MSSSSKHLRAIAVGLLAAGVLTLLVKSDVLRLGPDREQLLAEKWQQQLTTLEDEEIPAALRQLAEQGEAGIPLLVEAAGSYRTSVALAARRALVEEMDHIATLRASEAAPRLIALAHALAEHVDKYGPATRGLASYLADRILRAPLAAGPAERAALLVDCQKILDVTADSRRPPSADLNVVVHPDEALDPSSPRMARNTLGSEPRATANPDVNPLDETAKQDGSRAVGVESAKVPTLPGKATPSDASRSPKHQEPRLIPEVDEGVAPPQQFPKPPSAKQLPLDARPSSTGDRRAEAWPNPAPELNNALPRKLDDLGVEQVVALLGAGESRVVKAAHVELERRGFTPFEFEIAAQATSDNPAVRRELVDKLWKLPHLDARPWLIMLSRDSDAEVRLAVVAVLSTSTMDPTIASRLEEIARDERDSRIAALARRAIGRTTSRGGK